MAIGLSLFVSLSAHAAEEKRLTSEEEAILCLDLKTLSRLPEETALFHDMSARVHRMETTVAEIRRLLDAAPVAPITAPVAVAPIPAPPPTPSPAVSNTPTAAAPLPWLEIAGGGMVVSLLGYVLLRRRRATTTESTEPSSPVESTQPIAPTAAVRPTMPPRPQQAAKPVPAAAPLPPQEYDESIELADVMISMGLTEGAAEPLLAQIRAQPKRALFHWLKLLDVYRSAGRQEEFEKMAAELRRNFNIQAGDWGTTKEVRTLESYAHICKRIQELWRQPAPCIDFIMSLLGDNRDGTRAGFPQTVAEELLLLVALQRGAQA